MKHIPTDPPHLRLVATDAMDPLSAILVRFLIGNAGRAVGARVLHSDLATRFRTWLDSPVGDKSVSRKMTQLGYETQHSNGKSYWRDICWIEYQHAKII